MEFAVRFCNLINVVRIGRTANLFFLNQLSCLAVDESKKLYIELLGADSDDSNDAGDGNGKDSSIGLDDSDDLFDDDNFIDDIA